jgi:hypothetical protein
MSKPYIETRKTWIKAIHKCIEEKWNPICMGCGDDPFAEYNCSLCKMDASCENCSLGKSGDVCAHKGSTFHIMYMEHNCDTCRENYGVCIADIDDHCPQLVAISEAEAMLEALVMLLPPEERKRYEP